MVFKIGAVGIIVAVLHTILKQAGKEEHGWLVTLTGVIIVMMMVIRLIGDFFHAVRQTFQLF